MFSGSGIVNSRDSLARGIDEEKDPLSVPTRLLSGFHNPFVRVVHLRPCGDRQPRRARRRDMATTETTLLVFHVVPTN